MQEPKDFRGVPSIAGSNVQKMRACGSSKHGRPKKTSAAHRAGLLSPDRHGCFSPSCRGGRGVSWRSVNVVSFGDCASPLRGPGGDAPAYNFPRLKVIELIEYIEGYDSQNGSSGMSGKTRSGLLPTGASLAVSVCAFGLVSGSRLDADLMLLTSSSASRLR